MPGGIDIRTIRIDGRATGINQLDRILDDAIESGLSDSQKIRDELIMRGSRAFNDIPSKKEDVSAEAPMAEYYSHLRKKEEE